MNWHRLAAVGVALLAVSACGTRTATAMRTVTAIRTTTATATVTTTATKTTASTQQGRRSPEACAQVLHAADGNVSPVLCPDGNPNSFAMSALSGVGEAMFALGPFASPDEITAAGCADLQHGSTNPIETSVYQFMAALNGWSFGIDPSDGGLWSSC